MRRGIELHGSRATSSAGLWRSVLVSRLILVALIGSALTLAPFLAPAAPAATALSIQVHEVTVPVVNMAASQSTATVTCPAGQVLVGGGAHEYYGGPPVSAYEPINGLVIKGTVPSDAAGNTTTANDPSSWTAYGGFAGQSENNDLDTAFAMCATGGPPTPSSGSRRSTAPMSRRRLHR